MPLTAEFSFGRMGNTVPYPPNRRRGRTNAGFTDLRGRPELVDEIHEAMHSPSLAAILRMIAAGSDWISLGCDLGTCERKKRTRTWHYAGGYIQLISSEIYADLDYYKDVLEHLFFALKEEAGSADWTAILEVREVRYLLDGIEHDIESAWVWFDVGALNLGRAKASRERLLEVLQRAIARAPAFSGDQ